MRLLYAIEIVALFAYRLYVFGDELALEYMTFKFDDIADIDFVGAAQAFHVHVDIGTGAIFEKTIALGGIEPLHSCTHSF